MYYLIKTCSFCLRNEVKLKPLNKIPHLDASFMDVIKGLIEESVFLELGHVLLICEDCTRRAEEIYSFFQTSIKNNKKIVKYLRQLRTTGSDFCDIQVRINRIVFDDRDDFISQNRSEINESNSENIVKCEVAGDDVNIYKISAENKEIKIEKRDDFDELYGHVKYEEMQVEHSEESIRKNSEPRKTDDFSQNHKYKCGKAFLLKVYLQRHSLVHEEKLHKCEICGKAFTWKGKLTTHMLVHTGEKPYKCETCKKSFIYKVSRDRHNIIHSGVKAHACKTCGKSFYLKTHLDKHILIHTGKKPYKCETCGKLFARKDRLNVHLSTHSIEKLHRCKTCGDSFAQKEVLIEHMLIHVGEKPYECDTCGKSFTRKSHLKQHLSIHTGEKPYVCETCGKSFTRKENLTDHTSIHADVKPFECTICGKSFTRKKNLSSHLAIHKAKNVKPEFRE